MADRALVKDEDKDENLGLTLSLSADLAGQLRQHRQPTSADPLEQQPKLTFLSKKKPGDSDSDDSDKEDNGVPKTSLLTGPNVDPLDNWNEMLPAAGVDLDEVDENNQDEHDNQNIEDQIDKNDGDDDDWSDSPPENMPVVVVNLQRLVGYIPSDETEIEQLEHQIHAALWYGSSDAASSKQGGNPQEDNIEQVLDSAQHFDERVTELMQSGVAQHSTTTEESLQHQVVVSYPEFLCSPKNPDEDKFAPRTVYATSRIWRRLLRPHHIPVVASLLAHLRNCNRSLVWKHAMHQELWDLAKSEDRARTRRQQARDLREWKTVKREHQLEQLYQVRETMEHRVEMAAAKVRDLEATREKAVALEIQRRRIENEGFGGLAALDLNSTILGFPETQTWLGLEEEEDGHFDDQIGPSFVSEDEDDDGYDQDSDGSGYDAEGDAEDDNSQGNGHSGETSAPTPEATDLPAPISLPRRDNKARRAKVAKKRRRRLEEAAKEAEHQSKLDRARAEEAKVRELCTSTDLKMAQAILAALEKKMASVDELLESLQEEAWADEEAEESGQALVPDEDGLSPKEGGDEFSLLDQVLAMILGSFPPPVASKDEDASELMKEHTQRLQAEHTKIVKEWRQYFGRLPPSLSRTESDEEGDKKSAGDVESDRQVELRTAYGIEDNERDDWDEDSDNEAPIAPDIAQRASRTTAVAAAPQPQRVGLRPGGRVQG